VIDGPLEAKSVEQMLKNISRDERDKGIRMLAGTPKLYLYFFWLYFIN
jgi:hypothetical protein